jgi:single-stranded-DNA-specific exonuclease
MLPGVGEAADRILSAVAAGRRICVYGDYDVDGVTGSSILLGCLSRLGATADLHIPHRLTEGYGLNRDALRQIAAVGASVVVTVDCGIASLEEAQEARRLGLELIVTDHHEMKAELPDAAVLVHPRLPGTNYPFGQLCGAGVALKLAWALAQKKCGGEKVNDVFREFLLDAVAMAALGVVADVVPLTDENRIVVHYGLNRIKTKPLWDRRSSRGGESRSRRSQRQDIGFRLAPRINAAGRMGQARLAVDLLMATERTRAVDLALHLDRLNDARQTLERQSVARLRN